ncbi:hypothetical protein D3C86_1576500 [compost metagenome]
MVLDLALGLGDEAQAHAVTGATGQEADGERARVPDRVQQARTRAEFAQALGAPGEVVFLLARGGIHLRPHRRGARRDLLRLVQGLGADLADMVDTHQPGHMPARIRAQFVRLRREAVSRVRPAGPGRARDGAQRHVEFSDQRIHVCDVVSISVNQ